MEDIFEHFTITILKLNKLVQKIKLYEMHGYDLKAIHVMCSYYLHRNPDGLTASELSKLTLEDKAAISRAIKDMHEKGFVKYDANKYNAPIVLTDEGIELAKIIERKAADAVKAGSYDFTDEQRLFFYKSLISISENLENYYAELVKNKEDDDD